MDDKKSIARNLLKNRGNLSLEKLVTEAYSLTGDKRLISENIPLVERASITNTLLAEISKDLPGLKAPREMKVPTLAIEVKPSKDAESIALSRNINELSDAGVVEFTANELKELESFLPEGFDSDQLTCALQLYSKGVRGEDLERLIDRTPEVAELSDKQAQSLFATSYLISAFEEYDPHRSTMLQSQAPTIKMEGVSRNTKSTESSLVFSPGDLSMTPLIRDVAGKGIDIARNKVKQFAFDAIKKGGKNLSKKAVKKGAGIAIKAGVKTGAKIAAKGSITALGQALGTSVPIIGNVIAFIVTDVLPFVAKKLKQIFGKLKEALLGPDDKEKRGLIASLLTTFLFMAGGFTTLAAISGVVALGYGAAVISGVALPTAIAAFVFAITSVVLPSIGIPIAIALIGTPFVIASILFIINSGAYVVPRSPSLTPYAMENPYIGIEKEASPSGPFENSDLPLTVTYTITIAARRGTLTNIEFLYDCQVIGSNVNCPSPNPAIPDAPSLISPVEPYSFAYSQTYSGSGYHDSFVLDTFTVTADTDEVQGTQAADSATISIGNPPVLCPIVGGHVHYPSYNGINESGHGSNAYWGSTCNYDIPYSSGCFSPSSSADPDGNNICHYLGGECGWYGYAADFVRNGAGDGVLMPSISGESITWNKIRQFSNNGGAWGWGVTYRGTDPNGNNYFIYFTHLNNDSFPNSIQTGEMFGTLFGGLTNPHVHIEISINGQWIRPDYLCGGIGP